MKRSRFPRSGGGSWAAVAALTVLASCAHGPLPEDQETLRGQVAAVETAFARTMADRDFAGFGRFIDDEAVFLSDGRPLRGKAAVLNHWQKFFTGDPAPFSWRPETVEVLSSGTLAYSTGPVFDPGGRVVAHFASTWRREEDGSWKIIFDNGYKACGDSL